jgi:DNA-binding response OmpR family regulator
VVNILETIQIIKDYNIDIAILDLDIPDAEAFKILRHPEIHSKIDTEIVILPPQNESYYFQNKKIKIIHKPLNIFEVKNLIITTTHILEARNNTN